MSLLPSDQRSQAKIAVGVAALAAAAYYYQYPYAAAAERIAGQEARAERLEAANAKAAREAAKGVSPDALKREAARSRATLEMLRRLVPAEHEVPGLLEQVSTAARRAGLDLAGVAPEPVLAGSAFDTYRYKISVAGSYHPLAEFLTNVGSLTRIIAPSLHLCDLAQGNQRAATAPGITQLCEDAKALLHHRLSLPRFAAPKGDRPELEQRSPR